MADGMENWKSDDYFDSIGENPFKFINDDESPKEGAIPDTED
nr:hypothetical protein [uncultured Dethiosulfovibrio sp.]